MVLTWVRLGTTIFPVTFTDDMLPILAELMKFGPAPVTFKEAPPLIVTGPAETNIPPCVSVIPPFDTVSPPLTKTVEASIVEGVAPVTPLCGG